MDTLPLIETKQLTRRFGEKIAVEGLNFSIQPGEIFGFPGPNGAGKTTTLKMIDGLLQATSGSVRAAGDELATPPLQARASTAYIPDQPTHFLEIAGRPAAGGALEELRTRGGSAGGCGSREDTFPRLAGGAQYAALSEVLE